MEIKRTIQLNVSEEEFAIIERGVLDYALKLEKGKKYLKAMNLADELREELTKMQLMPEPPIPHKDEIFRTNKE